jgi:hypothetical protein
MPSEALIFVANYEMSSLRRVSSRQAPAQKSNSVRPRRGYAGPFDRDADTTILIRPTFRCSGIILGGWRRYLRADKFSTYIRRTAGEKSGLRSNRSLD